MTITYPIVKAIFDTLPIGYYLGRAIECTLSADGDASYFNVKADNIVISYPMIASAATELPESVTGDEVEQLVRGLLYHEISHVILTPKEMKMTRQLNTFEDERIESLCKNVYMNTDFFDNLIKLNHFKGEAPKSADEAFYQLVRFHIGEEAWLKRCRNLLKEYAHLNCNSYPHEYARDVERFYRDFVKDFEEKAEENKDNSTTSDEESKESSSTSSMKSSANSSNNSSEDDITSINDEASASSTEDESSASSTDEENEVNEAKPSTTVTSTPAHGRPSDIDDISINIDTFKENVNDVINIYYNAALISNLTNIITKAMKKNKRNGSAINSYSGKLDIRAVAHRDDYRWWVQQNRAGHVRHNSNVHFNLFIDNSGSFYSNDGAMNQFIKALDKIEKTIPTFSFDVITINTKVVEWPNHNQIFESCGGNKLLPGIKDVIKRHQKAQSTNYNIVLFDGDAHSDDEYRHRSNPSADPFKFFNLPNTIIISDDDNKRYIEGAHITQAKVRYTYNYCREFIGIICNLLEKTL